MASQQVDGRSPALLRMVPQENVGACMQSSFNESTSARTLLSLSLHGNLTLQFAGQKYNCQHFRWQHQDCQDRQPAHRAYNTVQSRHWEEKVRTREGRAGGRLRTGNDQECFCSVREAGEDSANGSEQSAAALRIAQQQQESSHRSGAVRQQIEQRRAVVLPELLSYVQRLPPQLHLPQRRTNSLMRGQKCLCTHSLLIFAALVIKQCNHMRVDAYSGICDLHSF